MTLNSIPEDETPEFTLGEVVRKTGLSKLVLHAWERRYEAVVPDRSPTGRRLYSEKQIQKLQLLKLCTENGHRIGKIAHLSLSELRSVAAHHQRLRELAPVLDAINALDDAGLDHMLTDYYERLGAVEFCKTVAVPLLREVGELWAEGKLPVSAEHMTSAHIRSLLGKFLSEPAPQGGVTGLFTTLSGELHEIGTLMAAVLARAKGCKVVYLGPQLPNEEIIEAAAMAGARFICLSSLIRRGSKGVRVAAKLRQGLPRSVELWLGGPGFAETPLQPGMRYFESLEEFEKSLAAFFLPQQA
ncbi:MerR family transcriptional regulator [Rhizobium paknamense]|uniref:DNA-binding transcriptional MerR regulator n=1 Tax=Rhizobium paknamense TaxID=1206817 RepID=A0ABU0IM45_9HYPH|nr:MerR family transcriptional regulator [Rhizobium paknamense]MDQ0458450.1 DNA-binding transcriptional MerR regulator [Rhizobium paknamense]